VALHGRAALSGVGAPWDGHGELRGEGEEGEGGGGEGVQLGAAWGGGAPWEGWYGGAVGGTMGLQPLLGLLLYVRRKEEGEEKGRKEKEGKEKRKKEKNMENFPNLKIFVEKNKR
jgi:hypothetical protein